MQHLVEVNSEEEQNTIRNNITARGWDGHTHFGFWIGLTDIFHDETWVWDNLGKPLTFPTWRAQQLQRSSTMCYHEGVGTWDDRIWDDISCETMKTGNLVQIVQLATSVRLQMKLT